MSIEKQPPARVLSRRSSLRLPQQLEIPIPPTLRHSPYLRAPEHSHSSSVSSGKHPTEEEEVWLQDTVPLPSADSDAAKRGQLGTPSPPLCTSSRCSSPPPSLNSSGDEPLPCANGHYYPSDLLRQVRPPSEIPLSPPIVCCHHSAFRLPTEKPHPPPLKRCDLRES